MRPPNPIYRLARESQYRRRPLPPTFWLARDPSGLDRKRVAPCETRCLDILRRQCKRLPAFCDRLRGPWVRPAVPRAPPCTISPLCRPPSASVCACSSPLRFGPPLAHVVQYRSARQMPRSLQANKNQACRTTWGNLWPLPPVTHHQSPSNIHFYELPISHPVKNTRMPPTIT